MWRKRYSRRVIVALGMPEYARKYGKLCPSITEIDASLGDTRAMQPFLLGHVECALPSGRESGRRPMQLSAGMELSRTARGW